jgi:hypothetical protein
MYIRHPINTTVRQGPGTRRDGSPTDCQNATFHDPAAPSNVGANGQGDRRRVLIWHEMGMVWDMSRDKVECGKSMRVSLSFAFIQERMRDVTRMA